MVANDRRWLVSCTSGRPCVYLSYTAPREEYNSNQLVVLMQTLRILPCFTYWVVLTVLLLAPNPDAVVGLDKASISFRGDTATHFLAFSVLALLAHGTRWPKRIGWPLVTILAVYGIATESLQAFVPARVVALQDYTENILGVAAGTIVYWLVGRLLRQRRAEPRLEGEPEGHATMATATAE